MKRHLTRVFRHPIKKGQWIGLQTSLRLLWEVQKTVKLGSTWQKEGEQQAASWTRVWKKATPLKTVFFKGNKCSVVTPNTMGRVIVKIDPFVLCPIGLHLLWPNSRTSCWSSFKTRGVKTAVLVFVKLNWQMAWKNDVTFFCEWYHNWWQRFVEMGHNWC